ncbi:hypothetical protein B566_EDAN015906 [Ephemera danica]|nr:hypothetical protein B566_EDAN015906 [Ephemera danica]
MGESRTEFKLKSPPDDGISSVQFGPNAAKFLLVSSWDSTVRLYDVESTSQRLKYSHSMPVLDICFQDAVHCFSDVGAVVTGSWDSNVKLWDPRSSRCVATHPQHERVYTMSMCGELLVVGTAGRVGVGSTQHERTSAKTRVQPQGYVLSSIEGRVAVEYLDVDAEVQKKKYAFKCHRIKEGGIERIFPVNAISFHNTYNTFATGGSDGYVNVWDGFNKKRLCQFHPYPTSIASLCFSSDGSALAIACSYLYEQDEKEPNNSENNVYIRFVTDQETKPK